MTVYPRCYCRHLKGTIPVVSGLLSAGEKYYLMQDRVTFHNTDITQEKLREKFGCSFIQKYK